MDDFRVVSSVLSVVKLVDATLIAQARKWRTTIKVENRK